MRWREFLLAPVVGAVPRIGVAPLAIRVYHVLDGKARLGPETIRRFWSHIRPEAARDLGWRGIRLECSMGTGEIWRPAYRGPVISGLEPEAINLVITDRIPVAWDNGRDVRGAALRYRGHSVCVVALNRGYGNEIPLAVNTSGGTARPNA